MALRGARAATIGGAAAAHALMSHAAYCQAAAEPQARGAALVPAAPRGGWLPLPALAAHAVLLAGSPPALAPAPARPRVGWFGWGRGGDAAPPTDTRTGKDVLHDICVALAAMTDGRGHLADVDGLPTGTLVTALHSLVAFFPHVFSHGGWFSAYVRRTVGRHITQLTTGAAQAAVELQDAPPEALYTCGRRASAGCTKPRPSPDTGVLLYPVLVKGGADPPLPFLVPWADVLDLRDVAAWEVAKRGRVAAARDRRSVVHALQWCYRLLHFMLVFMDVMLAGAGAGSRATPAQAAREGYETAFRPHHNLVQASAARTGLAFVTHSRTLLAQQMGFSGEQETERDMAACAKALRPVVAALGAFLREHDLDGDGAPPSPDPFAAGAERG